MAFRTWGVNTDRLLWIRAKNSGDALWTAEQILKNGSCGGVLLWQKEIRPESLRRLNLSAQTMDTWFWLMRPLASVADASPAPLRLALRPAFAGVSVEIVKRRGPSADREVFVSLPDMPTTRHHKVDQENAVPAKHLPATITARSAAPVLV
jgi:protein ImuA